MAEFKHTSGPWFNVSYAGYWEIVDGPYYENAQLLNEDDYPNAEANARLAACAPELLEMLMAILNSPADLVSGHRDKAIKIIQKATE